MSEKNFLLYPYDISSLFFLTFDNHFNDNSITEVVSPSGWGYVGEDAGKKIGIETRRIVTDNIKNALSKTDGILLVDSILSLDDFLIEEIICEAIKEKKQLIVMRDINKNIYEKYHEHMTSYAHMNMNEYAKVDSKKLLIDNIEKPIILIIGSGDRCQKFDIQLLIRDIFLRKGYTVSQIGSKPYSEYFGFHSFPKFIFNDGISVQEKIKRFSDYVYYLDKTEKTDVIVIGVPGGILPYNDEYFNDFGIFNFIVSNAVNPDYVVFNSIFTDLPQKYFSSLENILNYKYNYPLDAIFLSNTYINWEATDDLQILSHITLDRNFVHSETEKYTNVYSLFNKRDLRDFESSMMETLTEYGKYGKV